MSAIIWVIVAIFFAAIACALAWCVSVGIGNARRAAHARDEAQARADNEDFDYGYDIA